AGDHLDHPQPARARDAGRGRGNDAVPRGTGGARCRPAARTRRAIPRQHAHPAQDRRAIVHRQDAEQLHARRADPADPAQREDHRCAPASARLLLLRFQAAFRAWAGLQLQPRGNRPLLPRLRGTDGALRRRASRPHPSRHLRTDDHRHRGRGTAPARLLRACIRGAVPALLRERSPGADRQFRTGPQTDLQGGRRPLAPFRTLARSAERRARTGARFVSGSTGVCCSPFRLNPQPSVKFTTEGRGRPMHRSRRSGKTSGSSRALSRLPLAAAICFAVSTAAYAQDAAAPQDAQAPQAQAAPAPAAPAPQRTATLEAVTVTAQKRTENLQKVPISLEVLGEEKLDELNVTDFDDYVKFLPSVSYQTFGPGFAQIYMRGVASGGDGNHSGSLPSVGVYLDEQPVTTIQGPLDLHIYDVARVEALAGPQGTLYGASAQAGALRVITNKPDP